MSKSELPFGYRWVTIRGKRVAIRDKGIDFSIGPFGESDDILDNKAESGEVERFVSDTEMYEARDDKERQLEEMRKEAERLNKEQKIQDIEKQRKSINRKIANAEKRITQLETELNDPYLSPYFQEKYMKEVNKKKELIRQLKEKLSNLR